jgi:hypothetical protein
MLAPMPDLTGSPAIDVALGLSFLFFVLSTICSIVNELISARLGWRSQFLEDGLRSMLSGEKPTPEADRLLAELAAHPVISGKVLTSAKAKPFPSYLNSKTFALAFLDTVAPPRGEEVSDDLLARARDYAEQIPDAGDAVRRSLLAFIDKADGNVERFRGSVETWFDLTMDRVSGWYKRRVQRVLLVLALVVTVALNADTFAIGQRLWKDQAVQAAVVQAQQSGKSCDKQTDSSLNGVAKCVNGLEQLGIPLGWTDSTTPDDVGDVLVKIVGLLTTTIALSFGAPFWFDVLGRFARLRTTGKPERPDAA